MIIKSLFNIYNHDIYKKKGLIYINDNKFSASNCDYVKTMSVFRIL